MTFPKIIILFFVFSVSGHSIYSNSFLAGFGLWQYNTDYVNTLELGWEQQIGSFQYALALPVFFPLDDTPFIYGIQRELPDEMFKNLSERRYLAAIFTKAVYDTDHVSLGLNDKKIFFRQSFLRGNPLFDPQTPFLGSHLFLRASALSLYTSSIQDPSLIILYTEKEFFRKEAKTSTGHLMLRPLFWMDTHWLNNKTTDLGASLEGQVWFPLATEHQLGLLSGVSYGQSMLRLVFGTIYEYNFFKLHAGVLMQDKKRRTSPLLNSLYPAMRGLTAPDPSHEYILGEKFSLYIGEEAHFFELVLEIYNFDIPRLHLSAVYIIQWKKFSFSLEYTNEEIISFSDLGEANTKNVFIGFDLNALVLKDTMRVGWSSYRNWDGRSDFKSRLYTKFIF